MVEIRNKYKVGVRRFGYINYIGVYSLYKKEVLRFLKVTSQTIIGPILTSILFVLVLSIAIGDSRADVLGVAFIKFLTPGLIAMQVVQQSFSHSSSSIMMSKMMGTIQDILGSPLSAAEVTLTIVLASVTRGLFIAVISSIIFMIFLDITIQSYFYFLLFLFLGSFFLGSAGFIAGLHSDKFDDMSTITNFIIVPFSFLSGTFYSIERLPEFLQKLSFWNPFFYIIDGFRYSFIGKSDGSLMFGVFYLIILSILIWIVTYHLFKKGYKIKS